MGKKGTKKRTKWLPIDGEKGGKEQHHQQQQQLTNGKAHVLQSIYFIHRPLFYNSRFVCQRLCNKTPENEAILF